MRTIIKFGRIINPATDLDAVMDLLIEDGVVKEIHKEIPTLQEDHVIDAKGLWVIPGLIDLHVHLREPGYEHKENIRTGANSAAKGGFTTICAMPNTNPVTDNPFIVSYIRNKAKEEAKVNVLPVGAITKQQAGKEMADIGLMAKEGICAISEDGGSVADASLMKKAMTYAKMFNLPIFCHSEEATLSGSGVMHSGRVSLELGLKGIPREAEDIGTARDMLLAQSTGAKTHICHVSTKGSVELLRFAKQQSIPVTAEVCPHHFVLRDEEIVPYDTNYKMNPPLREEEDLQAILKGLKDNTIDVIATDHAPHSEGDKCCTFDEAAFGIVGLETAVSLTLTHLVNTEILTPKAMVEKMSLNPARILGIERGDLSPGKVADITLINPEAKSVINKESFESKGKNTPFHNREVTGQVEYTLVGGQIVYNNSL